MPSEEQTGKLSWCVYARSHVSLFAAPWTVCVLSGSSAYVIFQARILQWVAIPYSRDLPDPETKIVSLAISCIGRWILYH